jgi:hypothetical protein
MVLPVLAAQLSTGYAKFVTFNCRTARGAAPSFTNRPQLVVVELVV